jgi:hypothetical protein
MRQAVPYKTVIRIIKKMTLASNLLQKRLQKNLFIKKNSLPLHPLLKKAAL